MDCCSENYQLSMTRMEPVSSFLLGFIFLIVIIIIARVIWLIFFGCNKNCTPRNSPVKTLIVVGSGGHTYEITRLVSGLSKSFSPRIYVLAETDKRSEHKVVELEEMLTQKHGSTLDHFAIRRIPRSREVGQSYSTSVLSTARSAIFSFPLLIQEMPDLILCNGPGTCIPICFVGFLLKVFSIKDVKIVYVESICRVKTLSLSAKLLYYFVDRMLVQWPQLQKRYPRTVYIGRIV